MKSLFAAAILAASAFLASPALAQSAPGANPELALLSVDLQNGRNSALSLQAQAEEKRKLRVLAANEAASAPAASPADDPSIQREFTATIPTGNGLVPARGSLVMPLAESFPASVEPVSIQGAERN